MSITKPAFDQATQRNMDKWLNGNYDAKTKEAVRTLIANDPQAAIDAFYTTLSFGTGGLRGIVGVGTNRMNSYTVMTATQGLANYLKREVKGTPSVLIGYDSRNESPDFAREAAQVLAGNGIQVYLYRHLRPTPLVSFGCRAKKCSAAIMITASHNPPYYNGYKVYWSDGGQVLPPHDQGIIDQVNAIEGLEDIRKASLDNRLIRWIDEEIDDQYLNVTDPLPLYPEQNKAHGPELKVVYSNLHGTGITMVPKILTRWGFTNVTYVESQMKPDGMFPTVKSANPEERAALQLGIDTLLECQGDFLIATDPDADRVGVAVRRGKEVQLLTGNQVAAICLEHICVGMEQQKRLPERSACVKSVVTTPLFRAIADDHRIACFDVLPGFKYISAKIHEWEQQRRGDHFLFGGEESYGYLYGTASRDKDAIISCALLCEVALQAKRQGKTLVDLLHDLYRKYGVFREELVSISYPETREGRERMRTAMESLRQKPFKMLNGADVTSVKDYLQDSVPADILAFTFADGRWLVVRPSGTEPKVKLYAGITAQPVGDSLLETIAACDQRLAALLAEMKLHLR